MTPTTTTTKPMMTALILSPAQYTNLRELLEELTDHQIVAGTLKCRCGKCDDDGELQCVPNAGEALDILDDAYRATRLLAVAADATRH